MTAKQKKGASRVESKIAARRALSLDELLDMCADAYENREVRSGFTEAMAVLHFTLPKAFAKADGPTEGEVRTRIIEDIYGPLFGDIEFTESAMKNAMKKNFDSGACVDITEETVAYCVFAARAYFDGQDALAWSYACDARHWGGVVTMLAKRGEMPKPGALLAQIRHQQTYKEHEKVADYWCSNIDPKLSAQKAADAVLQAGVTNLSHKKTAEIISALRKPEPMRNK